MSEHYVHQCSELDFSELIIFFFCNSVLPLYIHEDKCELQGQVQHDKIKQ